MITVLSVLRSGGDYDAEWVRKLRDGVGRNLGEHRFACLSDVEVPCERIALTHDFPGWWSKIELYRPGVIIGPTLYVDLDTIITGPLDQLTDLPYEFAMLRNFNNPDVVGSGVMWFRKPLEGIYEKFLEDQKRAMEWYDFKGLNGTYVGDQSFVFDFLEGKIDRLDRRDIRSYKKHCKNGLPEGTSLVCFHGPPKPTEVHTEWMKQCWI